jgi:TetR/AcrR family transcriptional regulator, repressor of fatR-cypB operon
MEHLFSHQGKKQDLIKAGLELFALRGYDRVSIRDIAKTAGVSEAALYKHFKGKEDLALYLFHVIIKEYSARLIKVHDQPGSAVDKLCKIVEITYDLYQMYPAEIRFALLSQYNFWDALSSDIKPHFIMKSIIEEGMASEEIPKQEVYLWITIYSGILLQPLTQYPYFYEVLPEIHTLKYKVTEIVRKLFN